MDDIKFVHLSEIEEEKIIDLMNDDRVGHHLPLLKDGFSRETCRAFLHAKQQLWDSFGFGPWAFLVRGEFAGWGGLQMEQGDVDFALILYPRFWGWGRQIFDKILDQAFQEMSLESITILLPPGRKNAKAITRLGFVEDGKRTIEGEVFLNFRLTKK